MNRSEGASGRPSGPRTGIGKSWEAGSEEETKTPVTSNSTSSPTARKSSIPDGPAALVLGSCQAGGEARPPSSEISSFSSPSPLLWFRLPLPHAEMPDVGHILILCPGAHAARALFLHIVSVGEGRKTRPVGLV